MTPKERAAMQQALEMMDAIINGEGVKPYQLEGTAFTLREALAEYERMSLSGITDVLLGKNSEQAEPNSTFMEGYRIGLAEMREKCAKVCDKEMDDWDYQSVVNVALNNCAAFIRAIKFEGDTGFRPVSEMIAEHKQDTKKAAAIEKAKMRKAEQEPVAYISKGGLEELKREGKTDVFSERDYECVGALPLYAAPVRTKDLTDDEICEVTGCNKDAPLWLAVSGIARVIIAADREKNK